MAEARQPVVLLDPDEAPEAAARNVLEENALDRILRAECEDVFDLGPLHQPGHGGTIVGCARADPRSSRAG